VSEILHFVKAKPPTKFQTLDVLVSSGRKKYSQSTHTKQILGQVHISVTIFVISNICSYVPHFEIFNYLLRISVYLHICFDLIAFFYILT